MRDLHCGDRNWTEKEPIRFFIQGSSDGFLAEVIIHGAARGADSIAGEIAEKLGTTKQNVDLLLSKFGL